MVRIGGILVAVFGIFFSLMVDTPDDQGIFQQYFLKVLGLLISLFGGYLTYLGDYLLPYFEGNLANYDSKGNLIGKVKKKTTGFEELTEPIESGFSASSLKIIGALLFTPFMILALLPIGGLIGKFIFISIALSGLRVYYTAVRKSQQDVSSILKNSTPKRTILYLRSFERDNWFARNDMKGSWSMLTLSPKAWLKNIRTYEQIISESLSQFGSVIAIGRPNETAPPIGAARHYTSKSEDWKVTVKNFIESSFLIILVIDFSEGLLWELQQVVIHEKIKNLIVLYPNFFENSQDFGTSKDWNVKFNELRNEFPFLPEPQKGTFGFMFSNSGEPIDLWSIETRFSDRISIVNEKIIEKFTKSSKTVQ